MALNTEKYINVYYNKGDRKPYDVNGKPIAYLGVDYVGANEATIIRFNIGDDTGVVEGVADVKRPDGEKAFLIMTKVTIGANVFYELPLTNWHTAKVGKLVIGFKAFDGAITVVDGVIQANNLRVIVSDIFNVDIGYSPNSTEEAPPFDPNDLSAIIASLSTKLDKANGINVVQALPTPNDNSLNGRWYLVKSGSPETVGKLYVFNNTTAVEVELGTSQFNFSTTGLPNDALTVGQMRYNDTTGSLDLGLKGNHILKVGEVLEKRVRNDEAVNLKVGQLVYVFGSVGNSGLLLVKKASNLGEGTSSKTFGMVATAMNTTNSKDGYVYVYGLLSGIDLNDVDVSESVFSAGDVGAGLWLGESGKITKTLPTADNKHSVFIGYLDTFSGNGSNCSIYVKIQNGYELNELHDVRVSAIADNHILRYNSTRQVWENTAELTTAESNISNLQGRMTTEEGNVDNLQGRMTTAETDITNIEDGTTIVGKALADQNGNVINTTYLTQSSASATYIPLSQKGANNGVVPLNSSGKISSIYLSGEQDDIQEFANLASFPATGEADILYVAIDTNKLYRWSGSAYVVISETLALGTTATTAYRGDLGLALEGVVNTANQVDTKIVTWNASTGKFVTNGSVALAPQLETLSPNLHTNERTTTASSSALSVLRVMATTSADMGDGFGGNILFQAKDNANTAFSLAQIGALRSGGDTTGRLSFQTNNAGSITEKMTILPDGKVGIGTTSPNQLLHVAGAINLHSNLYWFNGNADINGADTNLKFSTWTGSALTEKMRITGAGNVGIGTTSPNQLFEVKGAGLTYAKVSSATNGSFRGVGFGIENDASIYGSVAMEMTNGQMRFQTGFAGWGGFQTFFTNGSERMRITDSGNVGIGTTSPASLLDISGSNAGNSIDLRVINTDSSNANTFSRLTLETGLNIASIRAYSGAGGSGYLSFFNENAERLRIDANGNVGIGTTSPTHPLHISRASGDVYAKVSSVGASTLLGTRSDGNSVLFNDTNDKPITFWTTVSGSSTEKMRLLANGNVGIGTSSPANVLSVVSQSNSDGINIRRNSSTAGEFARLSFRINTSEGVFGDLPNAQIRAVRTDRGVSLDTDLRFLTLSNSTQIEGMRIRDDGLVGINETSPSAQLQVKSGATNRVPLIVDTLASHSVYLQEWKLNGTQVARVDGDGNARFPQIRNLTASDNSNIIIGTTGTTISRNIADTNPALIVNLANASATGNIQVWQKAGSALAWILNDGRLVSPGISNPSSGSNALMLMNTTGTTISRNVNDANVVLKVQQTNVSATGRLQEWIYGTDVVSSVEKDGIANFTGTPSNAQTVDYTLVLADKGKVLRINSSSNRTITIPLNSTTAFPIDTEIAVLRYGTGTVSVSPTAGVTLNSKNSERKISGQYGSVALKKIGTDEWVLVGSLEA